MWVPILAIAAFAAGFGTAAVARAVSARLVEFLANLDKEES